MAVVRKVQSKIAITPRPQEAIRDTREPKNRNVDSDKNFEKSDKFVLRSGAKVVKKCQFCKAHAEPHYWDASSLRRHLNDRGRIYPRTRYGTCAKHQRRVGREIKHARHLALLPFTVRI